MVEKYANKLFGYVGIGKQSAIGTGVAATHFIAVTSANLAETPSSREASPIIRGSRYLCTRTSGRHSVAGTISGELYPDDFGVFWAWIMGNNNTVTGSGTIGYTHVFDVPNESTAPFSQNGGTIEVFLGGGGGTTNNTLLDYIGCFVTKATITIPVEGACTYTLDIVGVKAEIAGTLSTPTLACKPSYEGWMGKIKMADTIGTVADIEVNGDITLEIDNGIELIPALNGAKYPIGRSLDYLRVGLTFSSHVQDTLATFYSYFINNATKAVELSLTHTELAGSSSGVYSLKVQLPAVFFDAGSVPLEGEKTISQSVGLKALKDTTAGYQIKVTDVNSVSGVYTV